MTGSFEGDFISPGQYRARYRSNSVSVDYHVNHAPPVIKALVPAVIKWDKGGNEVYISGSFNKWEKKIPLVKRFVPPFPLFSRQLISAGSLCKSSKSQYLLC